VGLDDYLVAQSGESLKKPGSMFFSLPQGAIRGHVDNPHQHWLVHAS